MNLAFITNTAERMPEAAVTFNRVHTIKLFNDALIPMWRPEGDKRVAPPMINSEGAINRHMRTSRSTSKSSGKASRPGLFPKANGSGRQECFGSITSAVTF